MYVVHADEVHHPRPTSAAALAVRGLFFVIRWMSSFPWSGPCDVEEESCAGVQKACSRLTMRPVVVLSEPIHEAGLTVLQAAAEVRVLSQSTAAMLRRAIADADAVIVRLFPLTADLMAAAPRLRVIGRHGAGLANVDLAAATQRKIKD